VATAIGAEQTFARQTRLKLDELERIKEMICTEQKKHVSWGMVMLGVAADCLSRCLQRCRLKACSSRRGKARLWLLQCRRVSVVPRRHCRAPI
jgi:hypothetical protein